MKLLNEKIEGLREKVRVLRETKCTSDEERCSIAKQNAEYLLIANWLEELRYLKERQVVCRTQMNEYGVPEFVDIYCPHCGEHINRYAGDFEFEPKFLCPHCKKDIVWHGDYML